MSGVIYLIPFLLCLSNAKLATAAITHCYECISPGQPECDDAFNTSLATSVACSAGIDLSSLPGALLENIEKSGGITDKALEYYCVKLGMEYANGTEGIIRSCFMPLVDNVDMCDLLELAVQVTYVGSSVTKCSTCNSENNCNSAGSICASMLMIFVAMLLTKGH